MKRKIYTNALEKLFHVIAREVGTASSSDIGVRAVANSVEVVSGKSDRGRVVLQLRMPSKRKHRHGVC